MKNLEEFLEFEGKSISLLSVDEVWWIPITPICDVLNIDSDKQRERIYRHSVLSKKIAKHGIIATDGKLREMLCLPEKYIYGWLFSINSDNPELMQYQEECYEILFNRFHSALTFRINSLHKKTEIELQIADLQEKLEEQHLNSPEYQKIQDLKAQKKRLEKSLKEQDADLAKGQSSFSFN